MNPTLEIFSQGEEIITGQVVDTNANWLAQQAVRQGFTVTRLSAVGDKMEDLITLLHEICKRSDCCICTGGLGPTQDDLTTEAVSMAFNIPLEFDPIAFQHIQQFFLKRGRVMPETNRKQAFLPQGAVRLDNTMGTAPGFMLQIDRCLFVFLPGVPSEMRLLFKASVLPKLQQRYALKPSSLITIKTFGLGESEIQQRINTIEIPDNVQLGFLASPLEVQTKLLFPHGFPETKIQSLIDDIIELMGDCVFAVNGLGNKFSSLSNVVDQLMTENKHPLAIIESISQGLAASTFAGATWLQEASYEQSLDNLAKKLAVSIDASDLPNTAKNIAKKVQTTRHVDWVLVQLFENDESENKTNTGSIIIHSLLLAGEQTYASSKKIIGNKKQKQHQAAFLVIDLLRRYVQFEQYRRESKGSSDIEIRKYGLRLLPKK